MSIVAKTRKGTKALNIDSNQANSVVVDRKPTYTEVEMVERYIFKLADCMRSMRTNGASKNRVVFVCLV